MPCQRDTEFISFGINTKGGSPKTSRYLAEKVKGSLREYDSFVQYSYSLRNKIKYVDDKDKIMEFVSSDDFYFFYKKNIHKSVLKNVLPYS